MIFQLIGHCRSSVDVTIPPFLRPMADSAGVPPAIIAGGARLKLGLSDAPDLGCPQICRKRVSDSLVEAGRGGM